MVSAGNVSPLSKMKLLALAIVTSDQWNRTFPPFFREWASLQHAG